MNCVAFPQPRRQFVTSTSTSPESAHHVPGNVTRVPCAWIVGDSRHMEDVVHAVVQHAAVVQCWSTLAAALADAEVATPDLVLICQCWPEEYRADEVERLLESLPLARIICSYGPWCGSDGRTRQIWPVALRVPSTSAASRVWAELEVIEGRRSPLPRTAGLEEVFVFDAMDIERGARPL